MSALKRFVNRGDAAEVRRPSAASSGLHAFFLVALLIFSGSLLSSCGRLAHDPPGAGDGGGGATPGRPPGMVPGGDFPTDGSPADEPWSYCSDDAFNPAAVDSAVEGKFGKDTTKPSPSLTADEQALVGNWMGKGKNYTIVSRTWLQLRADGTYRYKWWTGLGNKYDVDRLLVAEGRWHLKNGNSQLVLDLPDSEAPLVFSARFPKMASTDGAKMCPGKRVKTGHRMSVDPKKDLVPVSGPSQEVRKILRRRVLDSGPDYFSFVACKGNSPKFWGDLAPPRGYDYAGLVYKPYSKDEVAAWEYAKKRAREHPKDYLVVITDEMKYMGSRKNILSVVGNPYNVNAVLSIWKAQMQLLATVKGQVLFIIAGDAPPYWGGLIREKYHNDANKLPVKLLESRFPEALELNPPNSFAGFIQVLDYLRMKYAPNVKLGYTLKTWGTKGFAYEEPPEGWDKNEGVKVMAAYLNSFDVPFDILSFNFNPSKGDRSDEEYKAGARYFAAISKKMRPTHNNTTPKVWVWKTKIFTDHPSFFFRNVDFMIREGNAIGVTVSHWNELAKEGGFKDYTLSNGKKSLIKTWMHEYYLGKKIGDGPHATPGPLYWR